MPYTISSDGLTAEMKSKIKLRKTAKRLLIAQTIIDIAKARIEFERAPWYEVAGRGMFLNTLVRKFQAISKMDERLFCARLANIRIDKRRMKRFYGTPIASRCV